MIEFNSICKLANGIKLKLFYDDKEISLTEVLPRNFCPLAFHSVYPYMLTLFKGGWLNWVGHNEHVIVSCPYSKGIAVYVKAPTKESPQTIELEVIKQGNSCFKNYQTNESICFNFDKENAFRFKLLDSAMPLIFENVKDEYLRKEFVCDFDGEKVFYRLGSE